MELTSQISLTISSHDFPYRCYRGNACWRFVDSAKVGLKWMIPLEKIYPHGLDLIWQCLNISVCGVKFQMFFTYHIWVFSQICLQAVKTWFSIIKIFLSYLTRIIQILFMCKEKEYLTSLNFTKTIFCGYSEKQI